MLTAADFDQLGFWEDATPEENKCSLDELIFGTNKKSYPAASKPLSDHTVDEFNQLLKRSLAEMMFQCLQHPEVQNVK